MVRKQKQGDKKQKILKKENKNKKKEEKNNERQRMTEMAQINSFTQDQGQIKQNCAEKQRKDIKSSEPMILKNYSGVFCITFLQIIATLFNGVEPTEILEFINFEYGRFLEILSLMMTDDEMPVVSTDLNMINQSCSLVNPQIPRSFSYGLKKLRELRGLTNLIQPLYLDHIDIRCLKIAQCLLIGVGQIDPNIKSKQKDQSQILYFHRITTYLLKRNVFLTPKLFYLIRDKWEIMMAIIYDQLKQDRQERVLEQTEKPSYDRTPSILPPLSHAQRQKLNNASQKSTAQKQQKQWTEKDQYLERDYKKKDFISIDFPEQQPLNQRLYDYGMKFLESDKKKDKETQSEKQQLLYDRTVERKKQQQMSEEFEKETVNPNEEINQSKREGQDYFGKSNAYQNFNYMKVKTIDRTKQNKSFKTKVIGKKGYKKVETKTQQKKSSIGEQQKTYKSQPNQIKYEKNMESKDDFMFGDQEDIYGRELQFSIQGEEDEFYIQEDSKMEQGESKMGQILLSEDMQSSERRHMESELERMAVRSQNSSMLTFVENTNQLQEQQSYLQSQQQPYQQSQQQQFQQSQQQEQLHRQQQTRQSFRHQNRQIDHLVDIALTNREQFVETMANQIYYELIVWNVRLRQAQQFQEERDSCCRKLFQK